MQFKMIPLVGALSLVLSGSALAQEQVVRIGSVAPTTGSDSHMGKDNENGVRIAVEEINAKGITIDGKKIKLQLLAEDDAADPRQATNAATKLVDARVAAVIGHLNSGTTIPASRIYSNAGIPQLSPSATNPKYTQQNFKTAFRLVANDAKLGGTLGEYAVKTMGGKTFAIIDDRTAYGQGVADQFAKSVKASGGNIVATQYTNNKATDFNAILTAIKAKKPDIIFFGGMDAVGGPMLRQMRQLGINAKFMGGDGICTGSLPGLAGTALGNDQIVCAEAGGVAENQRKAVDDFRAKYKKRFGNDIVYTAAYAYDATYTVVDAMKRANSVDPAKFLPEIGKSNYPGVTGTIAFDANGDIKDGMLTLYTYRNGKRELLTVTK
ncbi:MAG: branched-chain amino acid ABC transporter substrate-binding protein [Oxalicibacterium faecigallinarum]|uniref:Branched chain amino acid ABC transporter substrate-binding protein n=1 Tax=Oxalicibacterium faecigallinarum TaxID=573741 RepID=A0A8J3ATY6_9BURK|nr:branched-chain amino acid ABC transporter substrate-binding protein [Oxalicibacterium faecigallinarum]MDQ7969760.1 branched-chain amino acid ABC transporter substrate-binding protein [Oxalicibacterium faecigallinarum]GGI20550.1 branched chain amino acid ABC transporter substrate-binding protein [Oxalicibacterium faecigallinarum]